MTHARWWVHDLDPYLVELWPGGPIRWYGLAYLAGFLVAWLLVRRVLRAGRSPLHPAQAGDVIMALAIGAVVGARVGYAALYQPSLFVTFSSDFPFWGLLAIHEGGMASHGGMLGVVVAAFVFARRRRVPGLFVVDLAAFAAPAGLFFGRLANFVNGELYGRASDVPWAVRFPQELAGFSAARLDDVARALGRTHVTAAELIGAVQRGDEAVTSAIAPFLTPRHPSQLYEAALEGLLLLVVLAVIYRAPRRPGVVAGAFALLYGAVRIVVEFFREPDAHIAHLEAAQLSVTRGQLLSVALFVAGVVVLLLARRRAAPPLGGWR